MLSSCSPLILFGKDDSKEDEDEEVEKSDKAW